MNLRATSLFLGEKRNGGGGTPKKKQPPKITYIQLWPISRFCSLMSSERKGEGGEGDGELTSPHPVLYPHRCLPTLPSRGPGAAFTKGCVCLVLGLPSQEDSESGHSAFPIQVFLSLLGAVSLHHMMQYVITTLNRPWSCVH